MSDPARPATSNPLQDKNLAIVLRPNPAASFAQIAVASYTEAKGLPQAPAQP